MHAFSRCRLPGHVQTRRFESRLALEAKLKSLTEKSRRIPYIDPLDVRYANLYGTETHNVTPYGMEVEWSTLQALANGAAEGRNTMPLLVDCGFRWVRTLDFNELALEFMGDYQREKDWPRQRRVHTHRPLRLL